MAAYYNEFDKFVAQWLRNLIAAGHIAPGDVDERSIEDVHPNDLRGYTQCHFFAGIGVWSFALRRAGWSDDRPVWTGSCPCQPFSQAGEGAGFDDERHLWPAFFHLIAERRPPVILGEQVASKDADPWIDLVQDDMEALGYPFGAVPFPSAGIGAPHIRDRTYWLAYAGSKGLAQRERISGVPGGAAGAISGQAAERGCICDVGRLAHTHCEQRPDGKPGICLVDDAGGRFESPAAPTGLCGDLQPGPTNGLWRDADWLFCRDGKWRPVEPGSFPLVDGTAGKLGRVRADQERLTANAPRKDQGSRVGRLKGYGNAINAEAAQVFIETVMGCMP